ncbi:MAG: 16S rRNA (adenine(1518)-N(6)/adenine(1519)-N(6))-dimethyltransferase RsmA, partial [Dehalococcoidia bacterium]|nr:16S rRNA (adenine(1518)-N(6)/adenine(1519)-N(6))-dimethyltransferase RsmA [Dehalococcoidia bacterium]
MRRAKSLLRSLGKRPLKGLGQHFLLDTNVLSKIVAAAQLTEQDTVIEVGPGLGILTQELARRASKVIAVEIDVALADFLREALASYQNISIIQADILKTNPSELLGEGEEPQPAAPTPRPYKMVADLPYNIAAPVMRHFLEARDKPQLIVVMVQREVARRLAARPGKMSPLSVGIQLYGHPTIVSTVSPGSFYPSPKVHSAIVHIEVYPKPAVDVLPEAFFRVVRAGFSQPR